MKNKLIIIALTALICFNGFGQDLVTFDEQGWNTDQILPNNIAAGDYAFESANNFYTNYGYNFDVNQNSLYYVFQNATLDRITITTKNNEYLKFISLNAYQVSETSTADLIIEGWNGTTRLYRKSFSNIYSWQKLNLDFININKVIIRLSATTGITDYNFDDFSFEVIPLPVELTSFTAASDGKAINLKWETATELNNYGFEVERSASQPAQREGAKTTDWDKIGFVKGNGTANISNIYNFEDYSAVNGMKYKYRLRQIDMNGDFKYSPEIEAEAKFSPTAFTLNQNYPNPFNPTTIISWQSPESGRQTIKVYDILGNEAATLIDENKPAGSYKVEFNPGKLGLSSGVYIYKLISNDFVSTKKMIMLK